MLILSCLGTSFDAPVICLTASMTESLSSFWDFLSGERGDLRVNFLSGSLGPLIISVVITLGSSLNSYPPSWTFLSGDGAPVECAGGINES